jgi:hypothetical protein
MIITRHTRQKRSLTAVEVKLQGYPLMQVVSGSLHTVLDENIQPETLIFASKIYAVFETTLYILQESRLVKHTHLPL